MPGVLGAEAEIATTPWVDGCSCSDMGVCLKHKLYPNDPLPKRPAPETMIARAQRQLDYAVADYERNLQRVKEITDLRAEVVRLRAELEASKLKTPED